MCCEKVLRLMGAEYERILGENLAGIYIHGSLAFGCFHPQKSDLDFIVAVENAPRLSEKEALIQTLLDLSGEAPPKGFEMSLVLTKVCDPFLYPTPFELHYSIAHLQNCRNNLKEYCKAMHGTDKDLAAHFTVLKSVGYALVGRPIPEIFGEVPHAAYLDSLQSDVQNAKEDVVHNPVYVILNLCRVLAYQEAHLILSKEQGGAWGKNNLPGRYHALIEKALKSYRSEPEEAFDAGACADFCGYMVPRIFA